MTVRPSAALKWLRWSALSIALATGPAVGLGQDTGADSLTIVRTTAPDNIDPAMTCTIFGGALVNNLYDRLVEYKREGDRLGPDLVPMVAESWEVSDDGLEYKFDIRDGMTFASGNPLRAEDVVYSLERTRELGGCQGYNLEGGLYGNITSIEASDDSTVVIRFKEPDPLFLTNLTNNIGIIDKKVLEANGGVSDEGTAWLSNNGAGSGPFTLSNYDPESQIVLEARADYWQGAPGSSRLVFQIAKDASTVELLLNSSAADAAYDVPLHDIDRISQHPALKVVAGPALTFVNVGLNINREPLSDIRVRQALTHATPVEQIIEAFGGAYAHPLVGPIMRGQPFHAELENPYPFDLEKAKALIDEAGAAGTELSIIIKSGENVHQEIATVLQEHWRQIGLEVEIRTLGSSAFFDELMGLKHDMYMIEDKSANSDPGYLLSFFVRCGDPYNWTAYCDPQVDELLSSARSSLDQAEREKAYTAIAEKVTSDAPYIQLFQKDLAIVAGESVDGFVFSPESEDRYYWLHKN